MAAFLTVRRPGQEKPFMGVTKKKKMGCPPFLIIIHWRYPVLEKSVF
jgi:hypothetical protein